MKNPILTIIFSCMVLLSTAQEGRKISNAPSKKHVEISGTRVSLVPPDGFSPGEQFSGFQQSRTGSSVLVVELPGPFSKTSQGFTKQGLKTQGVLLLEKESLRINDFPAILITAEQYAYGTLFSKYILTTGNENHTVIINGMFPAEKEKLGPGILASMLSVIYEPERETNPLETAKYEIDVSGTKLQFAEMAATSLMYTVDGQVPPESADKTVLILSQSLGEIAIEDKKQYAIDRIRKLPTITEVNADSIKAVSIGGISGYEIVSMGKNDQSGEAEMVYQLMLFDEKVYYILVGICKDDFKENRSLFEAVGQTFRVK